jgi:hypothetical protein
MIGEKLDDYPTLLVAAWVGAAVGAITLLLTTQTDVTPFADLLGAGNTDLVYSALGAAGIVSLAEDFGLVEPDDFGDL